MITDRECIRTNNTRLFELLLKATRTTNKNEAIQWWEQLNETLRPVKQTDKIIQTLAQQLDKDHWSILHYVAFYNNLFICCKLAELNCDFNNVGNNGENILHIAARSKSINEDAYRATTTNDSDNQQSSLLIYLLSTMNDKAKPIVNINQRDNQGRTPLHHAVMASRIANVKILIDYGASIIIKDIRQATPLHYACRYNKTHDIVQYLLIKCNSYEFKPKRFQCIRRITSPKTTFPIQSKSDYMNAKTTDGHDAFSIARFYNNEEIVEELFKHLPCHNYHWQEKDKITYDQLQKAILNEDLSFIDSYPIWLVINENTGETPLHIACKYGCCAVVLHLLDRQYSNNNQDPNIIFLREKENGFTPILSAAYAGQSKCFEHMLNNILKIITTNNYSHTLIKNLFMDRYDRNLLHICVLSRKIDILKIFLSTIESNPLLFINLIELMVFSLDYNDETPLHLAVRLNFHSICELILIFADKLDEIQQPLIYLDRIDGELIRSIDVSTENIQYIPSYMLSMLSKSNVYCIGYKNKAGRSSFHMAVVYGHDHIMKLFLTYVNSYGVKYLLEHRDSHIQTSLHIAAVYGHRNIVRELLLLNVDIDVRDDQESTPLHCIARCVGIKCYDNFDASVCILDMFLKYMKNNQINYYDILIAIDGFGHNCLETATISGNRPFVEYLLNLNDKILFKSLLRNAQLLDIHYQHIDTPLRKLVSIMPDLAYRILDIFITHIGDKYQAHHKIIYDFEFLEDHCYVQQWQQNIDSSMVINKSAHNLCCAIFCHHKKLEFHNEFYSNKNNHHQSLIAYTTNPHTLVHNNVLSIMCKCAKQIDLKNSEQEGSDVLHNYKLMHHPLCNQLTQLKWKQFGLPLFLTFFIIYCLYLIFFTMAMLRNKQSEYFYRLVNATFPLGYDYNETQLSCKFVAQRLVQLKIKEALKQPADRVLKTLVIIFLWILLVKDALFMIAVHRLSIVWRLYLEIITIILSFICLYDYDAWQSELSFRCPIQWQIGAFGVFLAWTTLLSYLRFIPIFGVYVVMFEVIMLKFLWFAPVLVVLICSYSSAFYMLLQNQPVFSTIPFAWFRSAFMVLDTGYEDRFFGPDSEAYISLYPVLFVLFLFFGVTMTILVNNLLIALAVGEIADLSAIARIRNATRRYELLREWEIFRLQILWTPAPLHLRHVHVERKWNRKCQTILKWIYRYSFIRVQ